MTDKLFAVYLGGRAPKSNTELHDVVFVVGETIKNTYVQLLDLWFGTPARLHIDSWMILDIIDGYRISLADHKQPGDHRLYFVNLGAYSEGVFSEIHANKFLVAENLPAAKARGKKELLQNWGSPVHTDDLYEVDDCLELAKVGSYFIHLERTDEKEQLKPVNGYHIIPKPVVEAYLQRKKIPAES